ncbi:MAG: bifunctional riboflavin kinase/FAD synthetase [bacterium]
MKVYYGSKNFPASVRRPVVALGNFDGVHLAHQRMFKLARRLAKQLRGTALAYTFDPHPVKVLSPVTAPAMLNTLEQRLELLETTGLDAVVVEPFVLKFAHLQAEDWFRKVVVKHLHAAGVVVGYDFTFGSHRGGTVETMEKLCAEAGLACRVLEAQMKGETLISSSNIRAFVAKGAVDRAAALLGRPYFVDGTVIQGAGRGASLGIRTANLKVENELLPLGGVYACWAELGRRRHRAVANLGLNPTFGGSALSVEAHLLKFRQDLYGKKLRLHFVKRLRDERPFASVEALVRQIHRDIQAAERVLA